MLEGESVACLTEAGLAASVLEIVQGGAAALEKVRGGLGQGAALCAGGCEAGSADPARKSPVLRHQLQGPCRREPERQNADGAVLLRKTAEFGGRAGRAGGEIAAHRADGL